MSAEVNPSVVNWLTSMMTMRLQVILQHIPVTEQQILHYVVHTRVRESYDARARNPNILKKENISPQIAHFFLRHLHFFFRILCAI